MGIKTKKDFLGVLDEWGKSNFISVTRLKNIVREDYDILPKKKLRLSIPFFSNILRITFFRAAIFHEGIFVSFVPINKRKRFFYFKGRAFNFHPLHSSYTVRSTFFGKVRTYFYELKNPDPLIIALGSEPVFDSSLYGNILKSDGFAKLHQLSKPDWMALLTPRNIFIVLIVLVGLWYFVNGGSVV